MRTTCTLPALTLALLAGTAAPRALPAQLTFAPPAAPANVAAYQYVDECLAASARVRDSVAAWGGVWIDTLTVAERRKPQADFAPARDAARRCADNLEGGDQDLAEFAPWLKLHLNAGRDDRAEALLERRLAAVPSDAAAERAAVLDSAAGIAIESSLPRIALAERTLDLRDQHDSLLTPTQLYSTPFNLMIRAWTVVGDAAAAARAARRLTELHERASRDSRERASGELRDFMLFLAHTLVVMDSSLAALGTQGTEAYIAIRRDSWARTTGGLGAGLPVPLGEPAPDIEADVWIGDRQDDGPRPTKGRVSLVVFVPTTCRGHCHTAIPAIRRIVSRFPDLEVTLLASTDGHVSGVLTPTTADEAKLLRETLLTGHRLPGALALEDARPWYLPAPDGRRIERPTPNEEAYGGGRRSYLTQPFSTFVVDREGTIVEHQVLGNSFTNTLTEDILTTVVETLFTGQAVGVRGAR